MTDANQTSTQRNISRTRITTIISFAITSGINLLLIAYFARLGGLDLVAEWTFLNIVVMLVLILDFGVTNTLTHRIGRDGLDAAAPLLRRAEINGAILVTACTAGVVVAWALGNLNWVAILLAALTASLQLSSNWRITIRTGQHQQYFFNLKTMVRGLSQSGLVILLLHLSPSTPNMSLAGALCLGGILEYLFSRTVTIGYPMRGILTAPIRHLIDSTSSFGLTSLSHQIAQPLASLMIIAVLGKAGVAVFTLSLRIPVAISQSISEALRGLLPGLASLHKTNPKATHLLLRDAFVSQIILVTPLAVFGMIHTELLLKLWLGGEMSPDLPLTLRMLLGSIILTAITTPFFWANYALGNERLASRVDAAITILLLVFGGISLVLTKDIRVFVAIYAIAQTANSVSMILISERRNGVVRPVLRAVKWVRLLTMFVCMLGVNIMVFHLLLQADSSATKMMVAIIGLAIITCLSMIALRFKLLTE